MPDLTITASFAECPRCGRPHDELIGTAFHRPAGIYTHWATCPVTNEPILVTPLDSRPAAHAHD